MKRNKAVLKLPTFQWGKPGNSFSYSWVTDVFGQSKCSESRGNGKIRGVIDQYKNLNIVICGL